MSDELSEVPTSSPVAAGEQATMSSFGAPALLIVIFSATLGIVLVIALLDMFST